MRKNYETKCEKKSVIKLSNFLTKTFDVVARLASPGDGFTGASEIHEKGKRQIVEFKGQQ